ncbi:MAG: MarR family winged helix-turn-helix transcriptional regulator [Erythrobacter sp.]
MNDTAELDAAGSQPGESRLAGFLPYQLSIASNAVSSLIAERYRKRFGLKIPEWRVMAVLGDSAQAASGAGALTQRALTQRALAQATLMDKVAVNRAVRVLEDRGLLVRVPNPADGRSQLLELSAQGRAIHAEVMPAALATERELLGALTYEEQALLRSLLAKLRKRAGELGPEVR